MSSGKFQDIIEAAKKARQCAYCPYSRYPVGAAVLAGSGRMFTGANVENASYGLSLCAERIAVFNAISHGEQNIKAVCVAARCAKPCGACRQVLLEFSSKNTHLICVDIDPKHGKESVTYTRISHLLPTPFDPLESGLLPHNHRRSMR
jgi:cytidine deaminase